LDRPDGEFLLSPSIREIGRRQLRSGREVKALIKKNGGELKAGYAALGGVDLVLIVDLPDTARAMATSAALAKSTGIAFTTAPAVTVEEFDKLAG
jgi:uncharacterized protein with GYD domain